MCAIWGVANHIGETNCMRLTLCESLTWVVMRFDRAWDLWPQYYSVHHYGHSNTNSIFLDISLYSKNKLYQTPHKRHWECVYIQLNI